MSRNIAVPLSTLATQTPPDLTFTRDDVDSIAHLARMLAQNERTAVGAPELTRDLRPYQQLPEPQRAAMRAGVIRVVQALVLLGWIERPD